MNRLFSRRSSILVTLPNYRLMATKLQLKSEPGDFVHSRMRAFGENIVEQTRNVTNKFAKRTEDSENFVKFALDKAKLFLDISKTTFFITCDRALIVARSQEMKNAVNHSIIACQHCFFLLRRIFEEIILIARTVTQRIREKKSIPDSAENN